MKSPELRQEYGRLHGRWIVVCRDGQQLVGQVVDVFCPDGVQLRHAGKDLYVAFDCVVRPATKEEIAQAGLEQAVL